MGDISHVTTRVVGTQGYAAPEYLATGMFVFILFFFTTQICLCTCAFPIAFYDQCNKKN